jgi:hypothetical protein
MAFKKIEGFPGKLYVPDSCHTCSKKYPCADCFYCQHCSDERCHACLRRQSHVKKTDAVIESDK